MRSDFKTTRRYAADVQRFQRQSRLVHQCATDIGAEMLASLLSCRRSIVRHLAKGTNTSSMLTDARDLRIIDRSIFLWVKFMHLRRMPRVSWTIRTPVWRKGRGWVLPRKVQK